MYVSKETVDTTLGPWDGCHLASWEELIKLEKAMQDRYKKKKQKQFKTKKEASELQFSMDRTWDSKEIRDIKGTFHTTMGSIKDRNGMDLNRSRRY